MNETAIGTLLVAAAKLRFLPSSPLLSVCRGGGSGFLGLRANEYRLPKLRGTRSPLVGHWLITSLIVLALSPSLVGCASTRATQGRVEFGQNLSADGLTVKPEHIVEDSRCPMNKWCTVSGRLILHATVLTRRGSDAVDLPLGIPVKLGRGMLTLVAVTPSRLAGRYNEEPKPYRFVIKFERL